MTNNNSFVLVTIVVIIIAIVIVVAVVWWSTPIQSRYHKRRSHKTINTASPSACTTASKYVSSNVKDVVSNSYIVELRAQDGVTATSMATDVVSKMAGATLSHAFEHALYGCVVNNVTSDTLKALMDHDDVVSVHENGIAHAAHVKSIPPEISSTSGFITAPKTAESDMHVESAYMLPWGVARVGAAKSSMHLVAGTLPNAVNDEVWHLDTGADLANPDLNIVEAKTFVPGATSAQDQNGHGTHTAGIVGGRGTLVAGSTVLVGTAPGVKLHVLQVLGADGSGSFAQIIAAVEYVTAYAKAHPTRRHVVTMSLGAEVGTTALNALDLAIAASIRAGVLYCVAAGNASSDASRSSPAHTPGVLAIGAIDASNRWASYSNRGPTVALDAPGSAVLSLWINNNAAILSGTSMATPHVAGIAVLARLKYPTVSVASLRQVIVNAAGITRDDPAALACPTRTTNHVAWEGAF